MKKTEKTIWLIFILSMILIFSSCETDDEVSCDCKGAFLLENMERPFYAVVECETGAPIIHQYPGINLEYLGCVDSN